MNDRFSLSNDQFRLDGKKIKIPNLGWVRMRENLRIKGKILSAKIFKQGEKWFISIAVELAEIILPKPKTGKQVGLDLGITDLATLSDGTKIGAPKPLKTKLKKLQRLSKQLSENKKAVLIVLKRKPSYHDCIIKLVVFVKTFYISLQPN